MRTVTIPLEEFDKMRSEIDSLKEYQNELAYSLKLVYQKEKEDLIREAREISERQSASAFRNAFYKGNL